MDIKAEEISKIIREQIGSFAVDVDVAEVGSVISLGDGIARVHGVEKAMAGMQFVLHHAALPSVGRSIEDPATANAVNVDGTLNVLLASRDEDVRRVAGQALDPGIGLGVGSVGEPGEPPESAHVEPVEDHAVDQRGVVH